MGSECIYPQCQSHTDLMRRIEAIENKLDSMSNRLSACMVVDEGITKELEALAETFKTTKAELLAVITEQNKIMIQQSTKYIEDINDKANKNMELLLNQATNNATTLLNQASGNTKTMWKLVVILSVLLASSMGWDIASKSGILKILLGG